MREKMKISKIYYFQLWQLLLKTVGILLFLFSKYSTFYIFLAQTLFNKTLALY